MAASAYEVAFVSTAHDRETIRETVAAFGDALDAAGFGDR